MAPLHHQPRISHLPRPCYHQGRGGNPIFSPHSVLSAGDLAGLVGLELLKAVLLPQVPDYLIKGS